MYIHKFYPTGWYHVELSFKSNYLLIIHNIDKRWLLWFLIASLYPAKDDPNRVSKHNKTEQIKEIKLSKQ